MHVDEAITSRRSVRAFRPDPVSREQVEHILAVASRAPSGTNTQPWLAYAVMGEKKEAISCEVLAVRESGAKGYDSEYTYSPPDIGEPYIGRRRKVGWDLYGLLGIAKGDREKTLRQHNRNFEFFGAPVGLFFFVERHLKTGAWFDTGMFLANLMAAARGQGLHTCPQVAWTNYHAIVRKHLEIPDNQLLICGMSLGYEDEDAVVNRLRTEREPVEGFARLIGF